MWHMWRMWRTRLVRGTCGACGGGSRLGDKAAAGGGCGAARAPDLEGDVDAGVGPEQLWGRR
eukprot:583447-Prymnesium_polylepis.1